MAFAGPSEIYFFPGGAGCDGGKPYQYGFAVNRASVGNQVLLKVGTGTAPKWPTGNEVTSDYSFVPKDDKAFLVRFPVPVGEPYWIVDPSQPHVTGFPAVSCTPDGAALGQKFADVPAGTQFFSEIGWLADQGVSTGWDMGNGVRDYRPLASVNRDAMAAFMYRLAGSPAFTPPTSSPFSDVATENQFYKEMTWLYEQGISTGWDMGNGVREYRPLEPVNRDAMAAFMYRYAGGPTFTLPAASPFSDVTTDNQFYREISWLSDAGVSTGWPDGSFRPIQPVARDAMAAFMFRFANLTAAKLEAPGTRFLDGLPLTQWSTWTSLVGAGNPLTGTRQDPYITYVRLGADTPEGTQITVTVSNSVNSCYTQAWLVANDGLGLASTAHVEIGHPQRMTVPAGAEAIMIRRGNCNWSATR